MVTSDLTTGKYISSSSNTSSPPATKPDDDWETIDALAYHIETYYLWVILVLGFPGNCSTVVTIIKMAPTRSLTVYIALLAAVDNLAIISKILIFVLTDYNINIGSFGCKFLAFCGNFFITLANWLLVAMSVERFVAVWFPFKISQMWTFKKSLLVIGVLTLPLFVLFLHLFWTTDYVKVAYPDLSFCGIHEDYLVFMIDVWYWVNVTIYAIVPCFLLLTFNLLIVLGISKSRKLQQYLKINTSVCAGVLTFDRQRQVTVMLVTSALVLVILTTPRCVFLILSPHLSIPGNTRDGAILYLLDTLAYVMCDATHAVNFYLYSFSARRFRKQFRDALLCKTRWRRPNNSIVIAYSSRHSVRFHTTTTTGRQI